MARKARVGAILCGVALLLAAGLGNAADIDAKSFQCIRKMTPVRHFYVDNLQGNLDATLAAANSPTGAVYPPGSVIQLIPGEAMVKQDLATYTCPDTTVIDLGGRTVIPGLTDAHIHAIRGGQSYRFETHWNDVPTLAAALRILTGEAARRPPTQWLIIGGGWHPDQFQEKRAPTSSELTAAVPDHPVIVEFQYDWAILNKKGVEALGLTGAASKLPAGVIAERSPDGQPTGVLKGGIGSFSVLLAQISKIDPEQRKESLLAFLNLLSSYGVTGVVDAAGGGSDAAVYDPLFSLWRENRLPVRVAFRISAQSPENEPDWYRQTLAYMPPAFGDEKLHFAGLGEIVVLGMNDGTRLAPGFAPTAEAKARLYDIASWAAQRGYLLEIHAYACSR